MPPKISPPEMKPPPSPRKAGPPLQIAKVPPENNPLTEN